MRNTASRGNTAQHAVERARRGQIAAEGFFDDDPRLPGQAGGVEPVDDRLEQRGRDGEIVRRAARLPQRLFERVEGAPVVVVSAHIIKPGKQVIQRLLVIDTAGFLDGVPRTLA